MMASIWRMYEYTGDEDFFTVDAGLLGYARSEFGSDTASVVLADMNFYLR